MHFGGLREPAVRMRNLHLRGERVRDTDLSCLTAAELPSWEILMVTGISGTISVAPITSIRRPRLQTLLLSGRFGVDLKDLSVLATGPNALPALRSLTIKNFGAIDWSFMRGIALPSLKSLVVIDCRMNLGNVVNVGEGLRRLPQLEVLEFKPSLGNTILALVDGRAYMTALLGDTHLPCWRRLVTGGACTDTPSSFSVLMECAANIPQLEEIILEQGRVGVLDFAALAAALEAAGPQITWPQLALFQVRMVQVQGSVEKNKMEEYCRNLLQQARPDLAVEFAEYPIF